ncbi:hypothetical protein PT974_06981 [Cladobotryum mycophilum]|uniref:Uncharacterized protein n=1 Tax=Cladobotryum mycophilum TaxID=491253 RepID=A0ABR0SN17_9HYPO
MYLSEYPDSRRASAQRRYRKQKRRISQSDAVFDAGVGPSSSKSAYPPIKSEPMPDDDSNNLDGFDSFDELLNGPSNTAPFGFTDMLLNRSMDMPSNQNANSIPDTSALDIFLNQLPAAEPSMTTMAFNNSGLNYLCLPPLRSQHTADTLPNTHNQFYNKVSRMSEEMSKLYEFGVEMQLMLSDTELSHALNTIKGRFQKSIICAANSPTRSNYNS